MRELEGMLIGKNTLRHYVGGMRKLACNGKCALCGDMSEHEQYISLDPTARSRYLAKLGLTEVDDPLALWNDSKFKCLSPALSTCTSLLFDL